MKKHNLLPLIQGSCFILINFLLQSCGGLHNLPLEAKAAPTQRLEQIEGQVSIIEQEQEHNSSPPIMPELWQYIFSYLDFEGVLTARAINRDWNELITGFRETAIVGLENKPRHMIHTRG